MLLRTYARSVVVVLIGLAAMAALLEVSALGSVHILFYLSTAAIFAYVGFRRREASVTRTVVGGYGILCLICGVILAILFVALDFPFEGSGYVDTLGLAGFGGISSWCVKVLPCEDDPPEHS